MKKILPFFLIFLASPLAWSLNFSALTYADEVNYAISNQGFVVNNRDKYGYTALMQAADSGSHADVIKALLDAGAKIEMKGPHGETALFHAVAPRYALNAEEILATLIDAGANVNATDENGRTPLMAVAAAKEPSLARLLYPLVMAGADLEAVDNEGNTAVMIAAMNGSTDLMLTTLMQYGASVAPRNHAGKRAYDLMKENNKLKNSGGFWELKVRTDKVRQNEYRHAQLLAKAAAQKRAQAIAEYKKQRQAETDALIQANDNFNARFEAQASGNNDTSESSDEASSDENSEETTSDDGTG